MLIKINVIGNPGLYRDLRDAFAAESTTHRTWTGAARRLVRLNSKSRLWGETTGQWGGWEIIVDGINLYEDDPINEPTVEEARALWRDPVAYIAEKLQAHYEHETA